MLKIVFGEEEQERRKGPKPTIDLGLSYLKFLLAKFPNYLSDFVRELEHVPDSFALMNMPDGPPSFLTFTVNV